MAGRSPYRSTRRPTASLRADHPQLGRQGGAVLRGGAAAVFGRSAKTKKGWVGPPRWSINAADVDPAEQLPHRPGRARPLWDLWRPLRRRDADAADPGSRAGL